MNYTKILALSVLLLSLASAKPLLLIMDSTGSMADALPSGMTKMEAAKESANSLVDTYGDSIALMVYEDCDSGGDPMTGSNRVWVPYTTNTATLKSKIDSISPQSSTPIADAIREGADYATSNGNNAIVVLTDGEETCGGNVANAIDYAISKGVTVNVIGFALDASADSSLSQTVQGSGGKYYKASDAQGLRSALGQASGQDAAGCCGSAAILLVPLLVGAYIRFRAS